MATGIGLTFGRPSSGWKAGDEPLVVAEEIDLAESRLSRFRNPLVAARREVREAIKRRFDTETDPDGVPWAQYSPKYQETANRENIGKLHKFPEYHRGDQEQLYDAATDINAYIINSHSMSFGAYSGGDIALVGEALPDYWVYHQDGTVKMPARPFLGIDAEGEEIITGIFDAHVEGSLLGAVGRSGQPIIKNAEGKSRFASYGEFGN